MILYGPLSGHFEENPTQEGFCHRNHENCILFSWCMCCPVFVAMTSLNHCSLQTHKYNLWIIINKSIFFMKNNLWAAGAEYLSRHLSNDIVGGGRSSYKSSLKSPKG